MSNSNNWTPSTAVGWEAYYKLELLKLQQEIERKKARDEDETEEQAKEEIQTELD
tara:strand:+ start:710 stop:874 length:165 start_codon:yes stop_codon:yes gene_type:complete